ncbi:hypothetical protein ACFVYJ_04285 [Pontibacter sp. JAM-7]|uniref:hypothetical protein n=1 Tax=Pontibacter sp. JAM-7 TaxID=3366581 RepID=UPI003AF8ABFC
MTKRTVILIVLAPFVLIILLAGGYLVVKKAGGQYSENKQQFEQFGFKVIPGSKYEESTGLLGGKQLPPTFGDEKLTPAQRVIRGLIRDNERLIEDKKTLQSELESLREQVTELQNYRRMNEHFAPLSMNQQLAAVEQQMTKLLQDSKDARRFNTAEQQAMAAAVKQKYHDVIRNRRLMLDDEQRQQFVSLQLSVYAFCVGDGIQIAANSADETRAIQEYFADISGETKLSPLLLQDLETVTTPCQRQLELQLADFRTSP